MHLSKDNSAKKYQITFHTRNDTAEEERESESESEAVSVINRLI